MKQFVIALCLLLSTTVVHASSCSESFVGGQAPSITNPKMTSKYRELCNQAYAVGHSGITRTPLWAAEHLTRDRLLDAKGLKRSNSFRADSRLPFNERAELTDYARSGYDRGHIGT